MGGSVCGTLAAEAIWVSSTSKVGAISSSATINVLKGRAQQGVECLAQRTSVLDGERKGGGCWKGGVENGQKRWGSGPQGHVKAIPCPVTPERL